MYKHITNWNVSIPFNKKIANVLGLLNKNLVFGPIILSYKYNITPLLMITPLVYVEYFWKSPIKYMFNKLDNDIIEIDSLSRRLIYLTTLCMGNDNMIENIDNFFIMYGETMINDCDISDRYSDEAKNNLFKIYINNNIHKYLSNEIDDIDTFWVFKRRWYR